jgi:hypothetical protein
MRSEEGVGATLAVDDIQRSYTLAARSDVFWSIRIIE